MKKEDYISELSSKELAAQCVIPRLSAGKYHTDSSYQRNILELVNSGVGGFCVFDGSMNNVKEMISSLQKKAKIPLLFCADYEYGLPMRLDSGTAFPHAMALGKSGNTEYTYRASMAIALEAKSIGINWNLAPVCDVNSNKDNPIINIRSFGEDANIVSKHVGEYIRGLHSYNLLSCAKHFPGHGDTDIDSHISLPVLQRSKTEIESLELMPFIYAINNDVKSIMTGHLAVPALDSSNIPASLSKKIITGILRKKLNYDGLIITDALDMLAITNKYSNEDVVMMAVEAGNDILLLPPEPISAIDTLEKKANADTEFRDKLIKSVERIRQAKKWCGLLDTIKFHEETPVPFSEHEKLALGIAYDAIEIFGDKNLIPIEDECTVAGFAFLQTEDIDPPAMFFRILGQAIDNDCDFGFIDEDIQDKDLLSLKNGVQDSELIIFAFFFRPTAYHSLSVPDSIIRACYKLSEGKKTIAVLFGNPYLKDTIKADLIISPYSDSLPALAAVIMKMSGRRKPNENEK